LPGSPDQIMNVVVIPLLDIVLKRELGYE